MPTVTLAALGKTFDARPDRIDLRDREYRPQLVSLDEQFPEPEFLKKFFPQYVKQNLVLDQGSEGSCTGFGLAAVINFVQWKHALDRRGKPDRVTTVSPRMLYQLARIYDEWPGEDYEGSSCRGAMKGWHKHGVCARSLWEYLLVEQNGETTVKWVDPLPGYLADAAKRPLGAYYRVNKDSIADLQSALHEVGAVYVSANVHGGWDPSRLSHDTIPVIDNRKPSEKLGGHAFALVGFTTDGFIVQNSWGPGWGNHGFAVLPYDQWADFGVDAWVAVMGAPMRVPTPPIAAKGGKAGAAAPTAGIIFRAPDMIGSWRTRSTMNIDDRSGWIGDWSWSRDTASGVTPPKDEKTAPYSENVAYQLTVVLGNNGRPINQFIDRQNASDAVKEAARVLPLEWFRQQKTTEPRLAIYAHGGLNDEAASIKRIRVLAPYFIENGVYPLFITWKTGVWESITGALSDAVTDLFGVPRAEGLGEALTDAKDYTFEKACEHLGVRGIWSEMKQNASGAAEPEGGLQLVMDNLAGLVDDLAKEIPGFQRLHLHLVGHSAGSILLGYLLGLWPTQRAQNQPELKASTCTLWAPACTMDFAADTYAPAIGAGTLGKLAIEAMDDERERADTVAVYGKSLLYLVSRALEQRHKTPLLGMEAAWSTGASSPWNDDTIPSLRNALAKLRNPKITTRLHGKKEEFVSNGKSKIRLAHGSFDNDVDVVARMLSRISGHTVKPESLILAGF